MRYIKVPYAHLVQVGSVPGGGGGTPLQEANRNGPLDGVAFLRLE